MTTVAGLGIDLLEIERIERALERRPALATRLFTEGELEFCNSKARPARHLAARFAAKEAAIKALGINACPMKDIEIFGGGTVPPTVRLHGRAGTMARERGVSVIVSITHDRQTAAAVATLV